MKILHAARQFHPCIGGIERFTLDLSRELIRRGHRSDVVTLNRDFNGGRRLASAEEYQGIGIRRLRYVGARRYAVAPGAVAALRGYDVVNIHSSDFLLDYLAFTRPFHRRPLVLSTHGGYFHTPWGRRFKRLYFGLVTRAALRFVDRVVCDSESDYRLYARVVPADKVRLVHDGIDYTGFSTIPRRPERGRLLSLGRLARHKGIDDLIRLIPVLRADIPEARLIVVGPDWERIRAECEALARDLGVGDVVEFKGCLADEAVREEIGRAEYFVSASRYEGFGISLLEAMSAGLTPIVNRIRRFEEVIADGENGFMVDFGNVDQAQAGMIRALRVAEAVRRQMSAHARATASEYAWERVAGRYEEAYRQAMAGPAIDER